MTHPKVTDKKDGALPDAKTGVLPEGVPEANSGGASAATAQRGQLLIVDDEE